MLISFDVQNDFGDVFRVSLSSGEDAYFATSDVIRDCDIDIEIVEIDLERIQGEHKADLRTLEIIADGIGRCFFQNTKAVLYYYCDEQELPVVSARHTTVWPQEYRSQLFSKMFQRYTQKENTTDIIDLTVQIMQSERPIFMHIIARECHRSYLEVLKNYIIQNYGK